MRCAPSRASFQQFVGQNSQDMGRRIAPQPLHDPPAWELPGALLPPLHGFNVCEIDFSNLTRYQRQQAYILEMLFLSLFLVGENQTAS